MNIKVVAGLIVIVAGIVLSAVNFIDSNVEYGDFADAQRIGKRIQVKGEWVRDQESFFDAGKAQFIFYMKDDAGVVRKVVLEGAKPNNFELATSVVAKGKIDGEAFHASEVLTKCPSKYEGDSASVQKTL
ncbi:MAG: cytochrome c maturation protein CcmE [Bacteroidetes bacterium]|jgi:cytochrome c-type biogenesis protein CcmE|nr:cytochrome c maturation protein CcmE [Bacteroidota bacterium]